MEGRDIVSNFGTDCLATTAREAGDVDKQGSAQQGQRQLLRLGIRRKHVIRNFQAQISHNSRSWLFISKATVVAAPWVTHVFFVIR